MKKRKYKLANKLFVMIGLGLVGLLSVQLIFQSMYLENFYIKSKSTTLTSELETLARAIKDMPPEQISNQLLRFSEEQGAAIGLMDSYGNAIYGLDAQRKFVTLMTGEEVSYKVYMDNYLGQSVDAELLKVGGKIKISGLESIDENTRVIYPHSIEIDGHNYDAKSLESISSSKETTYSSEAGYATGNLRAETIQSVNYALTSEASMVSVVEVTPTHTMGNTQQIRPIVEIIPKQVEGTITQVYTPSEKVQGNEYRENKLVQEVNQFLTTIIRARQVLSEGVSIVYEEVDSFVGISNMVGIVPILIGKEPMFLSAIVSLQQVEEAVDVLNRYSAISFIGALLIALVVAYLYAKKITKPLVELRNVTTQIANLDFSTVCTVESQDEIGDLADNINSMSMRLEENLEMLRRDIELKDKLDQQRKQFIADVSHELKTPLTVLTGTCYGIRDGMYRLEEPTCLEGIEGQINRMSELVKELLEAARLEKEIELDIEAFDLSHAVLKVHRELKYLVEEKSLEVQLELEESIVFGDRKKIETVIRNLYNNAIFYTPTNNRINIAIEKSTLNIENEGVTLDEAIIPDLWEPFYRVDQSRNKALGGSGLGLYMVKQILEKHEATYGIGSTDHSIRAWFTLEEYS